MSSNGCLPPERSCRRRTRTRVRGCRCGSCSRPSGCAGCCSPPRRSGAAVQVSAAVVGDRDLERRRRGVALLLAPERRPADVDRAEERARRGVVGPDLLLVGERRRRLPADDHRRLPRGLARRAAAGGGLRVVGARDGDRLEALEGLLGARGAGVRGQVRVVETRAVAPAEPAGPGPRTEGDRRVAVRLQPVLRVPRQRADRPRVGGAPGVRRRRCPGSRAPSGRCSVGCVHVVPLSNEKYTPETPTPGVKGQVLSAPELHGSISISSLDAGDEHVRMVGVDRRSPARSACSARTAAADCHSTPGHRD